MLKLDPNRAAVRWFVWCCDHLGIFTAGTFEDDWGKIRNRTGAWYLENGTTLCHVFWAAFWFPLIAVGTASMFGAAFVMLHIDAGRDPTLRKHFGAFAYAFPEMTVLAFTIGVGTVILAIFGAGQIGILGYIRALKRRVCPLVTFCDGGNA